MTMRAIRGDGICAIPSGGFVHRIGKILVGKLELKITELPIVFIVGSRCKEQVSRISAEVCKPPEAINCHRRTMAVFDLAKKIALLIKCIDKAVAEIPHQDLLTVTTPPPFGFCKSPW